MIKLENILIKNYILLLNRSNDIFETLRRDYEDHINRIQYLEQQMSSLKNDDEKKKSFVDIIGKDLSNRFA